MEDGWRVGSRTFKNHKDVIVMWFCLSDGDDDDDDGDAIRTKT